MFDQKIAKLIANFLSKSVDFITLLYFLIPFFIVLLIGTILIKWAI